MNMILNIKNISLKPFEIMNYDHKHYNISLKCK